MTIFILYFSIRFRLNIILHFCARNSAFYNNSSLEEAIISTLRTLLSLLQYNKVVTMLVHRLRHWSNIETTRGHSIMFTAMFLFRGYTDHSSCPWTELMSLNGVHVSELRSGTWTEFRDMTSVQGHELRSGTWTEFRDMNWVQVHELSLCPWTEFRDMNWDQVHELSSGT